MTKLSQAIFSFYFFAISGTMFLYILSFFLQGNSDIEGSKVSLFLIIGAAAALYISSIGWRSFSKFSEFVTRTKLDFGESKSGRLIFAGHALWVVMIVWVYFIDEKEYGGFQFTRYLSFDFLVPLLVGPVVVLVSYAILRWIQRGSSRTND